MEINNIYYETDTVLSLLLEPLLDEIELARSVCNKNDYDKKLNPVVNKIKELVELIEALPPEYVRFMCPCCKERTLECERMTISIDSKDHTMGCEGKRDICVDCANKLSQKIAGVEL